MNLASPPSGIQDLGRRPKPQPYAKNEVPRARPGAKDAPPSMPEFGWTVPPFGGSRPSSAGR